MTTQELIQIAVANQSANIAIITAVIAILGVIISGFVSLFIAKWTAKNEKNKIHQENSKILLQKRMEIYPELWEIVSSVYGVKKSGGVSVEDNVKKNKDMRLKIRTWRKKNGLFLSYKKNEIKFSSVSGVELIDLISSHKAIINLEESLHLKKKYNAYDKNKIERIDKYRHILLRVMKYDIGVLENSNDFLKKELKK